MNDSIHPVASYSVRTASWEQDCDRLRPIREEVFILEQNVPVELEWDGEDEDALHLLAESQAGECIGTARMLADGHIGRVAVLKPWRGRGVGSELMRSMLEAARKRGLKIAFLDAQVNAIGFYEQFGFHAEGEIFMDAGIPHRHMTLSLKT